MQRGFVVKDANGLNLASAYRNDLHENLKHLTSDEAGRIAKGIAGLPDFDQVEWLRTAREGQALVAYAPVSCRIRGLLPHLPA
jgi:hypothetical protein